MSGTFNLGSQLSQEGSEGEFSGLSALLAAGQGALTAPGAADKLRGMQGTYAPPGVGPGQPTLLQGLRDTGLEGLAKGAEFLGKGVDIFGPGEPKPGFDMETLQAAALPVSQATGDLAFADAQRALRDYENQMAADESMSLIDDDGRRRAIRAAMEAAGHLEEVIVETLGVLGLKQGGRVGFDNGGSTVTEVMEETEIGGPLGPLIKDSVGALATGIEALSGFLTGVELKTNEEDIFKKERVSGVLGTDNKKLAEGGVASVLPKGKRSRL